MLLQTNYNSFVIQQKQKQTNKNIYDDWVSKLSCKIKFFVSYNGHKAALINPCKFKAPYIKIKFDNFRKIKALCSSPKLP